MSDYQNPALPINIDDPEPENPNNVEQDVNNPQMKQFPPVDPTGSPPTQPPVPSRNDFGMPNPDMSPPTYPAFVYRSLQDYRYLREPPHPPHSPAGGVVYYDPRGIPCHPIPAHYPREGVHPGHMAAPRTSFTEDLTYNMAAELTAIYGHCNQHVWGPVGQAMRPHDSASSEDDDDLDDDVFLPNPDAGVALTGAGDAPKHNASNNSVQGRSTSAPLMPCSLTAPTNDGPTYNAPTNDAPQDAANPIAPEGGNGDSPNVTDRLRSTVRSAGQVNNESEVAMAPNGNKSASRNAKGLGAHAGYRSGNRSKSVPHTPATHVSTSMPINEKRPKSAMNHKSGNADAAAISAGKRSKSRKNKKSVNPDQSDSDGVAKCSTVENPSKSTEGNARRNDSKIDKNSKRHDRGTAENAADSVAFSRPITNIFPAVNTFTPATNSCPALFYNATRMAQFRRLIAAGPCSIHRFMTMGGNDAELSDQNITDQNPSLPSARTDSNHGPVAAAAVAGEPHEVLAALPEVKESVRERQENQQNDEMKFEIFTLMRPDDDM